MDTNYCENVMLLQFGCHLQSLRQRQQQRHPSTSLGAHRESLVNSKLMHAETLGPQNRSSTLSCATASSRIIATDGSTASNTASALNSQLLTITHNSPWKPFAFTTKEESPNEPTLQKLNNLFWGDTLTSDTYSGFPYTVNAQN